jgi:thiamine transport system substrate-binding protein
MSIPNNLKYTFSGLLSPRRSLSRALRSSLMKLNKKDWIASSLTLLAMTEGGKRHCEPPAEAKQSRNLSSLMASPPFGGWMFARTIPPLRHCEGDSPKQSRILKYFPAFILLLSPSSLYGKETLTVYTHAAFMSSSYGPGTHLKEAFEKTCDCEIRYVVLDTIPLVINRINFEGKKTEADVILGLEDIGLDVTHVEKLVPYASHCLAFVYDSTKIPNPPKTLDELIHSSYPIILQDPRSSITGLGFLVWMRKVYGDQAPQKWKTLASHVLTFTKGWTEAHALFKQGIAPIVFSYTTDALYNELEKGLPHLKALPFPEGHLCSNIYAGKLKTTQHSMLADQFLTFLLSPEAQDLIATHAWIYPKGDVPYAWIKAENYFPQPSWISYTAQEVKDSQKAWIQEWVEGLIQ